MGIVYITVFEKFDKSKCNDMEKCSTEEILAHTREGAKEISELDILCMLGLV